MKPEGIVRPPAATERERYEAFLADEAQHAREDREWERRRFEPYEGFGSRALGELVEREP